MSKKSYKNIILEIEILDAHPHCLCFFADTELLHELVDVISHYLLSKAAKDQMFLVMHESKRVDLMYCLLLDDNICGGNDNHLRLNFMTLLAILLRTNKVRSKI